MCQIKISEQGVFDTDNDYWKTLLALSEMVKYYKEVKRGENMPDSKTNGYAFWGKSNI